MFKIGDFSKFSRVSVKALRYYDEIGLLKPVRVDQFTGYRYYSAEQLPRLNRIVGFKDLGLSLEEISWILAGNFPPDKIIELLKVKHREALEHLREEEARLRKVEEWLRKMEKERIMPDYDIVLKKIEAMNVVSIRDTIPAYTDIDKLFGEFCSYLEKQKVQYIGPPLAIYYDQEYREKDVDVEVAVPIAGTLPVTDRICMHQLPAVEQMACLIHKGAYENLGQAYKALLTWAESNGYQVAGPDREVYIKGPEPDGSSDPENYITELQLPIKKV